MYILIYKYINMYKPIKNFALKNLDMISCIFPAIITKYAMGIKTADSCLETVNLLAGMCLF